MRPYERPAAWAGRGFLVCLLATLPRVSAAATCTWTGAGATTTWSTAANWDGCGGEHPAPLTGDRLVFAAGASGASSMNDLTGLSVSSVLVSGVPSSGGRYVIGGNGIVLTGELQFSAPPDSVNEGPIFNVAIALGAASTISNIGTSDARLVAIDLSGFPLTFTPGTGDVIVTGAISGGGTIVKNAPHTLVLQGPSTFTAPMQIDAGSVRVEHLTALGSAVAGTTVALGARLVVRDPLFFIEEPITLDGGVIATLGGPSLGTGDGWRRVRFARLTLTAESAIDLAANTSLAFTEMQGPFTLAKSGAGRLAVDTAHPAFTGWIVIHAGDLLLDGFNASLGHAAVIAPGGDVYGSGPVGALTVSNGWLWPFANTGGLSTGDVSLDSGATLHIDMFPYVDPSTYGRLRVTGTVNLANPMLRPSLSGPGAPMGTVFTIIDNDGTDPVVGTFAGLPEGTIVTDSGGSFVVSYVGGDGNDVTLTRNVRAPYILSEGATGPFFDQDIVIANPNGPTPVSLTFLTPDGRTVAQERTLPGASRTTIHVDQIAGLEATEVSTIVRSTADLPLAVERTMFWDRTYYAGHTGSSVQASRDWLFAEGAQGFFHTYLMLANVEVAPADVSLTFLREGAAPVVKQVTVAPSARLTVDCAAIDELANTSFGVTVRSTQPIVAERAMYFGMAPTRLFSGGHASAGATTPAGSWFFAEGATGNFFDTFVLLSNPQSTPALVTMRFLLDAGEAVTIAKTIPAMSRLTVNIEAEADPRLRHAPVSTVVTSDVPIVAERSMYWSGDVQTWTEGHNSFGANRGGVAWLLAEGRLGGPLNFHTYILLANPEARTATVTVTFLRESGFPIRRTYRIPANSRFNIDVNAISDDLQNEVSALIEVFNGVNIIVERSMYWDSGGEFFKGGTNATAARWR